MDRGSPPIARYDARARVFRMKNRLRIGPGDLTHLAMTTRRHKGTATVNPCAVDDLVNPDWTEQQRADFEAALPLARSEVNVAVTGITGSGKSALINALCGAVPKEEAYDKDGKVVQIELPAKEGEALSHETEGVASYEAQKASLSGRLYTVTVWDSSGLEDGTGRGLAYIQELHGECGGEIDMLLYCVKTSVRCIVEDMVPGMKVVTETLGPDVWRHAMVVLTFANILQENILEASFDEDAGEDTNHIFASRINQWQEGVCLALKKAGVPEEIASGVPAKPAGHYVEPSLPDRPHWLGYLWLQFLMYARDETKLAILVNNQHRIRDAEHLTPEDLLENQLQSSAAIPIVVNRAQISKALKIGTGASVGVASAAAGACVGSVAGGLLFGLPTAGIGTAAGLAAGAAVGAVVGPLVGMAVNKTLIKRQEKQRTTVTQ